METCNFHNKSKQTWLNGAALGDENHRHNLWMAAGRERAKRSSGMSLGEPAACLSRNLNSYLLALPTAFCNSRLWRDLPTTVTQVRGCGGEKIIWPSIRRAPWNARWSAARPAPGGVLRRGKQRHVSMCRRRASWGDAFCFTGPWINHLFHSSTLLFHNAGFLLSASKYAHPYHWLNEQMRLWAAPFPPCPPHRPNTPSAQRHWQPYLLWRHFHLPPSHPGFSSLCSYPIQRRLFISSSSQVKTASQPTKEAGCYRGCAARVLLVHGEATQQTTGPFFLRPLTRYFLSATVLGLLRRPRERRRRERVTLQTLPFTRQTQTGSSENLQQ